MNLRPELSGYLEQRLAAFAQGFRHNLVLIGPAGSGKTYQIQHLLAKAPARLSLIYCPIYRESCRSFLNRFACSILRSCVEGRGSETLDELLLLARERFPRTVEAIAAIEPLLARRSFAEALNRTLDVIPILIEERRQPAVIILDEFLLLEDLGLGHVFHELGKRVMIWPSALFILTSSSPYRARLILRERLQLLFGQFELISMEALDSAATAVWLEEELSDFKGAEQMAPFLMRWLGSSPWYLCAILERLKESLALRGTRTLTSDVLSETAWELLGRTQGPLHQWCLSRTERLNHLRNGARMMEVLIHVACGARTLTEIGRRATKAGLSEMLQVLVEQDLVERRGTCWFIQDPVLRCWLSSVVLAQRGAGLPDEAAVRARFSAFLSSFWKQWMEQRELSFADQVALLFGRFQDDILLLDSKTGRLPRFRTIRMHTAGAPFGVYLLAEADGKSWCAAVMDARVDENAVSRFDAFCRAQTPRPSRKVVVPRLGMEVNARLLAKAVNMWVWESQDWDVLLTLYGFVREEQVFEHENKNSCDIAPVGA